MQHIFILFYAKVVILYSNMARSKLHILIDVIFFIDTWKLDELL